MNQEIYADAVRGVHVTGNIVRLDLMTFQPHLKGNNGEPAVEVNKRVIMPLDGFVQFLYAQRELIKQFIDQGILEKSANPAGEPTPVVESKVVHFNSN